MSGQNQSRHMSAQELRNLATFREMAEAHIKRLGVEIERRRKELGWSRPDLARQIPVHEKTVERWEKGQTTGAIDEIETIAAALRTDPDTLLGAMAEAKRDEPGEPDQLTRIEAKLDELLQTPVERRGKGGNSSKRPNR